MKNVKSLVPDIYNVLLRRDVSDDRIEELGRNLSEAVRDQLKKKDNPTYLRMSNFGTVCKRKTWYSINMPGTAEALQPWTRLKFLYGHILEALVLWMAKEAGHKVEGEQEALEVNGLKGHRDAVIDGLLVDVKSANSRGFDVFKAHAVEQDKFVAPYLDQLGLYLEGSKDDPKVEVKGQAGFLAIDKEQGHLILDIYKKPNKDYAKEIDDLRTIVAEPEPPQRHYMPIPDGKSGNMKLPTECAYCPYKHECYKGSNGGRGLRTFLYSTGPRWLTWVAKTPDVPEVNEKIQEEA